MRFLAKVPIVNGRESVSVTIEIDGPKEGAG